MKKLVHVSLAAVVVLSLALMVTANASSVQAFGGGNGFFVRIFPDFNWIAPDGLPEGVSAVELYLQDPFHFNFNGETYAPPHDWQTFAGAAYKLSFRGLSEEPIKICFYYPKALYNGTWYGQIHRLTGSSWIGLPTTEEFLSFEGHGSYPFLCTNTRLPGIYIVVDYWTTEGYVEPPIIEDN